MNQTLQIFIFVLITFELSAQSFSSRPPPAFLSPVLVAPKPPTLAEFRTQNLINAQSTNPGETKTKVELKQDQQQNELTNGVEDIHTNYAFAEVNNAATEIYKQAALELNKMLIGNQNLSLKRAVFLVENAYIDNYYTYDVYCSQIKQEVDFIKSLMKEEGFKEDNDVAKKYFLQKMFSDTLFLRNSGGKITFTHLPYRYDFDDPFAEYDWQKMFVTKLLRTKMGQCHSMPLLYLILAEELNVEAWLSLSPQHSFIKIQVNHDSWYNFETTNGNYSSDSWILSSSFIKSDAVKNKIYLDTIGRKKTIAYCLNDLANGYKTKFGDSEFTFQCALKSLEFFPTNIFAVQTIANYDTKLFDYVANQLGKPSTDKFYLYPKLQIMYNNMKNNYRQISEAGYEEIPKDIYKSWLKSYEQEKTKQPVKTIRP